MKLELKDTNSSDLDTLFSFQLDKEANYLAAFTSKDPTDKDAFLKKWTMILSEPTINCKTIYVDGEIAGSITKYVMEGDAEITYWIGKSFWGKGIASKALQEFLNIEKTRPLFGRVAFDNFGSQKVLEKSHFSKIGTETGFATAREEEITEFVYKLS